MSPHVVPIGVAVGAANVPFPLAFQTLSSVEVTVVGAYATTMSSSPSLSTSPVVL
jgi:hypothetical protein